MGVGEGVMSRGAVHPLCKVEGVIQRRSGRALDLHGLLRMHARHDGRHNEVAVRLWHGVHVVLQRQSRQAQAQSSEVALTRGAALVDAVKPEAEPHTISSQRNPMVVMDAVFVPMATPSANAALDSPLIRSGHSAAGTSIFPILASAPAAAVLASGAVADKDITSCTATGTTERARVVSMRVQERIRGTAGTNLLPHLEPSALLQISPALVLQQCPGLVLYSGGAQKLG